MSTKKPIAPPNIENFNLNYGFAEDLSELPEDRQSVLDFCSEAAAWINQEMEKPEVEWDVKTLVSFLGKTAAFLKMVQELDDALEFIETAIALTQQHNLGPRQFVVQSLRWADILRYRGDFEEAGDLFDGALKICAALPDVADYKDVVLQHQGKLHFDLGEYEVALEKFNEALEIRKLKNDQSLIESTEIAIRATEIRMGKSGSPS